MTEAPKLPPEKLKAFEKIINDAKRGHTDMYHAVHLLLHGPMAIPQPSESAVNDEDFMEVFVCALDGWAWDEDMLAEDIAIKMVEYIERQGYHITPTTQDRQTLTDAEAEIAIKGALIEDEWGDCIDYEGLVARLAAQGIKLTKGVK